MARPTAVRVALTALAVAAFACGTPSSKPAPTTNTVVAAPDAAPVPDAGGSPVAATAARLAGLGYEVTRLGADETLVCGKGGGSCVCLAELDCHGSCITLEQNLAAFRKALASTGDRTVVCELADTGALCDLTYFRFEGDVYRYEDRYFGRDGRLIGIRNTTDYPEYCGGRAMAQFTGVVPDCGQAPRDVKVLCSDQQHARPLRNPTEMLELALSR